jgi:hypothetical protein
VKVLMIVRRRRCELIKCRYLNADIEAWPASATTLNVIEVYCFLLE